MKHALTDSPRVEFSRENVDAAVLLGIQRLNETCRGWPARVDLSVMDMSDTHFCVLGQVGGGSWSTGCYIARVSYDTVEQIRLGFEVPEGDREPKYAMLTAAWREALTKSGVKGA